MSAFEIFIIAVAGAGLVLGFISGLAKQLGSLAGIVLGVAACRLYAARAAEWLGSVTGSDPSSAGVTVAAYAGVFLAVYVAAYVASLLVRKTLRGLNLGIADRVAGALFRAFVWLFGVSLLLNVWTAFAPEHSPDSPWAERVEWLAPAVLGSETAAELWAQWQQKNIN